MRIPHLVAIALLIVSPSIFGAPASAGRDSIRMLPIPIGGATRYSSTRVGLMTDVDLYDDALHIVRTIRSRSLGFGGSEISFRAGDHDLLLRWLPALGQATLITDFGETFQITVDPKNGAVTGDIAAFTNYIDDIATVSEALDAVRRSRPRIRTNTFTDNDCVDYCYTPSPWDPSYGTGPILPPPNAGGGSSGPSCAGPIVRGTASALDGNLTRSGICDLATADANYQCSLNGLGLCLGCCRLETCDAYCAMGDYLCVMAGVTGQACSY